MKTQEQRLKQCISVFLFSILIFFSLKAKAFAYSSISPWQNESGPEKGAWVEPKFGTQSTDSNSLELQLNLNAAITPEFTAYGRYSLQTDQLLGLSDRFFQNRNFSIRGQVETTYSQDSVLGFTGGAFIDIPIPANVLPSFTAEIGLGVSNAPATGAATLPGSLLFIHHPETSGWLYGIGFSGESGIASSSSWISFRMLAGYQTSGGIRYGVDLALPATEINSQNVTALSVNLVIPFGAYSNGETPIQPATEISATPNPRYDLDAKVIAMNEALFLIKINRGSSDSVAKGQTFDIYSEDKLSARAQVIAVKKDEAALSVIEYNQEYWIELGFSARRLSRGME